MPQAKLLNLLEKVGVKRDPSGRVVGGIGEDAAVIKIRNDLVLIETVDFITPNVDDPYIQGKIAAVNVTNDVYNVNQYDLHA
ncbi:MAG: AIR synthase related protein [Candidatus Freyarchaeota archaeon]